MRREDEMKVRSMMGGLALVAVCTAGSALAIEAQKVDEALNFDPANTKVGIDVRAGVGGFTGDLGERTGVGPLMGIAAGAQPWRNLGIEAGYEGQRLPITDARVVDDEAMWRHNVSLLAKAGPLVANEKVRPYVAAGVGVSYLNASEGAEGLYDNDFIREVPLAAGVDYRFGALFAGARASYRLVFGEEFIDSPNTVEDADGNLVNFGVTLGGRF
jgi:opacity protein-like surface antigen